MQQLRDQQVGHRVVDRRAQEDDPLLQQARVDVEGALAAVGLLDDGGNEVVLDRLAHSLGSSSSSCSCSCDVGTCDVVTSGSEGSLPAASAASPPGSVRSTGVPDSSTTVAWSTRSWRALPRAMSERTASITPLRSNSRRTLSGFSSARSAKRAISASSSS